MSQEQSRQFFEQWIESSPDGCPVDRRPDGEYEYEPARTAWPLWCKLVAIVGVRIDKIFNGGAG